MIKILYFAQFRENLKCESEIYTLLEAKLTVAKLMQQLSDRGGIWSDVFGSKRKILIAVNQEMAKPETVIQDDDEIGFFPPVTGG